MSLEWLRWYHGTYCDPKLALVAKKAKQPRAFALGVWSALLECASQADPRGSILNFDEESVAVALDFDENVVPDILAAMRDKGMIVDNKLSAWEKRQVRRERDDNSRDRVAEYRKRHKSVTPSNAENPEVTPDSDEVTPDSDEVTPSNAENVTQIREEKIREEKRREQKQSRTKEESSAFAEPVLTQVHENLSPTPKVKSKKPPKPADESLKTLPIPDWMPEEVWASWVDYRIEIRNPMTKHAAELVIKGLGDARDNGYDPQDLVNNAIANGWKGCVFPDHRAKKSISTTQPKSGGHNGYHETKSEQNQRYNQELEHFLAQPFEAQPEKIITGERLFGE